MIEAQRRYNGIAIYVDGITVEALTDDAARSLRDQLDALLSAAPKARTPADVLTDPQPGDRVEWQDGEVWTVTGLVARAVGLWAVLFKSSRGNTETAVTPTTWAETRERVCAPFVCIPASDVPPPAA